MRSMAWITGAALGVGLAAAAWAGSAEGRHGAAFAERLGLSAEQEAQWREQREARREASRAQRDESRALREQLRALLEAPTVDENAVRALGRKQGELAAARARARVEERLALRKLLTPEQLEKLGELRREHAGARHARRQQRRGGRDGADEHEAGER